MPTCFLRLAALMGHPRARHVLVLCGLVVGLTLAAGAVLLIVESRRHDLDDAGRELKNLSLLLAEETDRAFQSVELVQLGLIEHLHQQGVDTAEKFDRQAGSLETHFDLQHRIAALPHISALGLVNARGKLVNLSSSLELPDIDTSDWAYFRALTGTAAPVSFINPPVRDRTNDTWVIIVGRTVSGADGRLIGIATAGLQLDQLEESFSRIAVARDVSFGLFRGDGVLLARYPHIDPALGKAYGANAEFHDLQASLDRGVMQLKSIIDGRQRIVAPHSAAHFPLILTVTNTVDAALAGWRAQARRVLGATALMEVVLAGIVWLGVTQLHAQERLIAADAVALHADTARALAESELALARQREQSECAAHQQSQRFDMALSNMTHGLLMFDVKGRLLIANQRIYQLCGLPADTLLTGMPYAEVLRVAVTRGNLTEADLLPLRQWRAELIDRRARGSLVWELADGRAIMVNHQPLQEGWISTYEDITDRRQAEARIEYMARHDALTDLPNRVLFRERLDEALGHARRGQALALLCLDLDQFKAVNDTLGHPIGDALLQAVARRLASHLRDSDTVARLGGDEYAIVQAPIARPADAAALADRLIELLNEPFDVAGHQIVIGTSIGIAFAPQDGLDPDQLLKSADLALYRAKTEGRGIYRLFQAGMDAAMQARRMLELDLRNALRAGELELFYQPLVELHARAVTGFEALLRWRHPVRGLIPPDHFIPLAEEIGVIVPIGEWVLRQACITAAAWPNNMKVAVNLSPAQFRSRNLVAATEAALRDSNLPAERLELEITESVLLQDTAATLATLHELRELGLYVAMDDFGTGYSSLSYLRQFPFDRIKIDQSFVRELGRQRDCGAIVRAVTALSRELGMATTAEGVETPEQLAALALAGCTDVQGFLFSRPVPEAAIPGLLRSMPALETMLPHSVVADSGRLIRPVALMQAL
jgi:diguanylate cyclase (GGDEF)-like protein/PAS domain S-box-containing protein